MKSLIVCASLMALMLPSVTAAWAQSTNVAAVESKDAAHLRVLNERAAKIVAPLGITDSAKAERVRGIIVQQYRDLSAIHEVRDAHIKQGKEKAGADKAAANAVVEAARTEAKPKLDKLHGEFLGKLAAELSPEQVHQVKDGLTYGVLPLTYGVYLKMYPELTEEQKKQIKSWLTEARELAMDGSTSDEKHAVFGKYKGKINNYLSKAGYDAKKAEQNLRKPAAPAPGTKTN
jgi:Spy/CpxP family protein refolding chaperone